MPKITPFLWFNNNLEEAINFYKAIFPNAEITNVMRAPKGGPAPEGTVFTATFKLEGQEFMALNGGPMFKFTEAISFFVNCEMQEEIDHYWNKLSEGGQTQQCGWLKDPFGISWQIVPSVLGKLLYSSDPAKSQRTMQAMMKMTKLEIAKLKEA